MVDAVAEEQIPSPEPKPIARQAAFEADRIGDILRRVREHRGEELEYISDYLRIRPNYLFALENSRYEDLPADAYVIGFLRTYAAYLGLDGKGAIDQYRREMMGRRRKPQLSMPQPMSEGRAPTIAVLVAAAIAALIIYGVWYGLSSPNHEAMETPVPLPDVTQAPVKDEPLTAITPNGLTAQTATSDGIELSIPASSLPATSEAAHSVAPETTQADKTPEDPAAKGKGTEAVKSSKDSADKKSDQATEPSVKKEQAQTPQQTAAEPATTPKQEPPATYGDAGKTKISIKAERESWVLVTDDKGNTVFDRTLKAGETYNVPSGKGLKLTTGNANGLAFSYDGKDLPKMKNSNPVVRAMPLDADKLKGRLSGDAATTATESEPD